MLVEEDGPIYGEAMKVRGESVDVSQGQRGCFLAQGTSTFGVQRDNGQNEFKTALTNNSHEAFLKLT